MRSDDPRRFAHTATSICCTAPPNNKAAADANRRFPAVVAAEP